MSIEVKKNTFRLEKYESIPYIQDKNQVLCIMTQNVREIL